MWSFIAGVGVGAVVIVLIIIIGGISDWIKKVDDALEGHKYLVRRAEIENLDEKFTPKYETASIDSKMNSRYNEVLDRLQELEMARIKDMNKKKKKP